MPALLDVNVLLAIIHGDHLYHASAVAWVGTVSAKASLIICRISQYGLLRLLNNPAVMGPDVKSGREVWKIWDNLLRDDRFTFAEEPQEFEKHFRTVTLMLKYQPKRWQDAALAAFALAANLEVVTFDRDFRSFAGLRHRLLVP